MMIDKMTFNQISNVKSQSLARGLDARLDAKLDKKATAGTSFADMLKAPEKAANKIDKTSKLYKQCLELESFLVQSVLDGARKTVQKSGLLDTGFAGQTYEDMLWQQYAEKVTQNSDLGLADECYLELTGQRGTTAPNRASAPHLALNA
jgi:flagellar protein FlgJ